MSNFFNHEFVFFDIKTFKITEEYPEKKWFPLDKYGPNKKGKIIFAYTVKLFLNFFIIKETLIMRLKYLHSFLKKEHKMSTFTFTTRLSFLKKVSR